MSRTRTGAAILAAAVLVAAVWASTAATGAAPPVTVKAFTTHYHHPGWQRCTANGREQPRRDGLADAPEVTVAVGCGGDR